MKQYKTIRVSNSVFRDLQDLQDRREQFISTVERLISSTKNPPYVIRAGAGKYCVEVAGNCRKLNTDETLTHVLRITEETFNELQEMKGHPDETFNTTMFRITTVNMNAPVIASETILADIPATSPETIPADIPAESSVSKPAKKKKSKPQPDSARRDPRQYENCLICRNPIPEDKRADAKTCSKECKAKFDALTKEERERRMAEEKERMKLSNEVTEF
jgi:predicted nucleic acid-binding Zn ribbon protein/predicted CopG family antitoxin